MRRRAFPTRITSSERAFTACMLVAALAAASTLSACAPSEPVGLGQTGSSVLSPQGIYDATYIRESEGGVRGVAGTPTRYRPASDPSKDAVLTYAFGTMETVVTVRSGEVFDAQLIDLSGHQPKVVQEKSAKGTTFP